LFIRKTKYQRKLKMKKIFVRMRYRTRSARVRGAYTHHSATEATTEVGCNLMFNCFRMVLCPLEGASGRGVSVIFEQKETSWIQAHGSKDDIKTRLEFECRFFPSSFRRDIELKTSTLVAVTSRIFSGAGMTKLCFLESYGGLLIHLHSRNKRKLSQHVIF
jgi:hypothetical protein